MSVQHPRAVEIFFIQALRRVAKAFALKVGKILYPKVARFAKKETPAERKDADDDEEDLDDEDLEDFEDLEDLEGTEELDELLAELKEIDEDLRDAADESFDQKVFAKDAKTASKRALVHNQNEFKRIGIRVPKEPKLDWLMDGWQRDNVARISGMESDQLDKVRRILTDGRNMRVETLQAEIERQIEDVTESRAEMIARDQVLTLNGQITRERQTSAGIEKFIWSTSQDERVREEHEELEGETFAWDEPPDVGVPGEDYQCRCVAYPILEELEDDEDTEDDEDA